MGSLTYSPRVYFFQQHEFLTKGTCVVSLVISILQLDYRALLSWKLKHNRHTKQKASLEAYKLLEQQNILLDLLSYKAIIFFALGQVVQLSAASGPSLIFVLPEIELARLFVSMVGVKVLQ